MEKVFVPSSVYFKVKGGWLHCYWRNSEGHSQVSEDACKHL